MTSNILKPTYRTIKGKRVVLLPEADFMELVRQAEALGTGSSGSGRRGQSAGGGLRGRFAGSHHTPRSPQARPIASRVGQACRYSPGDAQPYRAGA